jgi:hypothetical protein
MPSANKLAFAWKSIMSLHLRGRRDHCALMHVKKIAICISAAELGQRLHGRKMRLCARGDVDGGMMAA